MWIVRLALRRPYTFVVLSLMLFILAPVVISRTPTDIFPNIDIPVISVIWQYAGLSAQDISERIVYVSERQLTTTVNNVEHIESQSMNGIAVVKIFFQPHANVDSAMAQVTGEHANVAAANAPGCDAAAHHHLQRLHCADSAAGVFGRG